MLLLLHIQEVLLSYVFLPPLEKSQDFFPF